MPEMPLHIEAHSYLENRLEPAETANNAVASSSIISLLLLPACQTIA